MICADLEEVVDVAAVVGTEHNRTILSGIIKRLIPYFRDFYLLRITTTLRYSNYSGNPFHGHDNQFGNFPNKFKTLFNITNPVLQ